MTEPATTQPFIDLPSELKGAIERLSQTLKAELGPSLKAIVLYGSAARGDYSPAHSDVNIMLVVDEVSVELCDTLLPALRLAQREATFELFMVTPKELERSADVFPLKFLDIQRHHRVLYGQDPMEGIVIAWDHLRLRVEQQIKSLMFELRAQYLLHAKRPEQLHRVLAQSVGGFLVGVGALLYLRDPQWWITGKEHISELAQTQLGFDGPLMQQLMKLHRGTVTLTSEQLRALYDHFMALVDEAAQLVDELVIEPVTKAEVAGAQEAI